MDGSKATRHKTKRYATHRPTGFYRHITGIGFGSSMFFEGACLSLWDLGNCFFFAVGHATPNPNSSTSQETEVALQRLFVTVACNSASVAGLHGVKNGQNQAGHIGSGRLHQDHWLL